MYALYADKESVCRYVVNFCAPITSYLDTTKCTVPLDDTDLLHNCNTSAFKGLTLMREKLDLLFLHLDVSSILELRSKVIDFVDTIRSYLAHPSTVYMEWMRVEIARIEKETPNPYDNQYVLHELQKKCPYFEEMSSKFAVLQEEFRVMSAFLKGFVRICSPTREKDS